MDEKQNLKKVQGIYEFFGKGDIPSIIDLLAEDVDWDVPGTQDIPYCGHYSGREGVKEFFEKVVSALDVHHYAPSEFFTQKDKVIVLGTERMGVKVTGRTFESDWVQIWTLRDGKVIRFRELINSVTIMKAFQKDDDF